MKTIEERFWDKVDTTGDCWLWQASVTIPGYGQFWDKSRRIDAHRYSYKANVGEIPAGMVVMHTCDEKICVRPSHLKVGTQRENLADMYKKNRNRAPETYAKQSGENAWNASFAQEEAESIRLEYETTNTTSRKLAAKYGVAKTTILNILRRETYVKR